MHAEVGNRERRDETRCSPMSTAPQQSVARSIFRRHAVVHGTALDDLQRWQAAIISHADLDPCIAGHRGGILAVLDLRLPVRWRDREPDFRRDAHAWKGVGESR